MVSEEGLNAYGAVTWGQFFVYQGFNDKAGWMHTSSGVDNIDEFLETVDGAGRRLHVSARQRGAAARAARRHHPLQDRRRRDGRAHLHGLPEPARTDRARGRRQVGRRAPHGGPRRRAHRSRTRARRRPTTRSSARSMELHTNSSNNTVFADADGNIAYFHSNFIPRRDTRFDWTRPVDGSDPATEWGEPLSIDETPGVLNPPNGWIQNTNNCALVGDRARTAPRRPTSRPTSSPAGENPRGHPRHACAPRRRRTSRSRR